MVVRIVDVYMDSTTHGHPLTGSLTNNFTAVMKMEVYETISFIGILILDPRKKEVRAYALYLLRY